MSKKYTQYTIKELQKGDKFEYHPSDSVRCKYIKGSKFFVDMYGVGRCECWNIYGCYSEWLRIDNRVTLVNEDLSEIY